MNEVMIRDKLVKWEKTIANGSNATCKLPYAITKGHKISQIISSTNATMTYTANYIEEVPDSDALTINGTEILKDLLFDFAGDMKTRFDNNSGASAKANMVFVLRATYKPKKTE